MGLRSRDQACYIRNGLVVSRFPHQKAHAVSATQQPIHKPGNLFDIGVVDVSPTLSIAAPSIVSHYTNTDCERVGVRITQSRLRTDEFECDVRVDIVATRIETDALHEILGECVSIGSVMGHSSGSLHQPATGAVLDGARAHADERYLRTRYACGRAPADK